MKTVGEIVEYMMELEKGGDFFGFIRGDLVEFLPFEAAKPFLRSDAVKEEWVDVVPLEREAVKAKIFDYMPFAWDKANDCRGLSAGRSIDHMSAWLWVMGEDEAAEVIGDYDYYGKPQLRAICEAFGWDWRQWDDDVWRRNDDDPNAFPAPETADFVITLKGE